MILSFVVNNWLVPAFIFVVTLWIFWFREGQKKRAHLPPGPTPLPLIGNVHLFLLDKPSNVLAKLAKTYGDIFTVYLFNLRVVIVNSREDIKDALSRIEFAGRFDSSHLMEGVFLANSGVITSVGEMWRNSRKFCLKHLGDMGFGKRVLEPTIIKEAECLLSGIEQHGDQKFDISALLASCVSNVTCGLIFGKRYKHNDEMFLKLLKASDVFTESPVYLVLSPWVKYLPILGREVGKIVQASQVLDEIVDKHLKDHENEQTSSGEINDLIDAFLKERKTTSGSQKEVNGSFLENTHIRKTLADLLFAGTETTTSTLRWALVYLIKFPGVQKKLQTEIHTVIGTDRKPSLADKSQLVYTQAFIAEVLRLPTLTPTAVPHMTVCDVTLKNYHIPSETIILPNLNAVHMDVQNFPDPEVFRPERFIDDFGCFNKQLADLTMPFSTGKRVCLGELLARMEVFLFLTTMMQTFEFYTADEDSVDIKGRDGLINSPVAFQLCARKISS